MARTLTTLALAATLVALPACAQTMQAPSLTHGETLYVVPYAHLDTQWRWDFQQTIAEYLLKTMRVNFDLMDKYPHYVFNWSGSNRYRLMKEYYPADYARLKGYVARGNWYPAGSSVEEGDVNLPSAEAILRQVLYGNTFFRAEFGKASSEYMLPDCFGFPASLPTILHHAGVLGFSTQKLNAAWQPAPLVGGPNSPEHTPDGIPYNVGIWQGPDGSTIMAALNPGNYEGTVTTDLSSPPPPDAPAPRGFRQEQDWGARIAIDGKLTGVFADYHYVGTGDIGGATTEDTVRLLEDTITHKNGWGNGPVHVVEAAADQMFKDIKPDMQARMPRYTGDLELINHSAGSLTSQAMHKRWNRKNELLADAAEKASVAAAWLGGPAYPQQQLTDAWTLVLGGQFHDTAAGTALPRAYEFAQNDDLIAANQFANVLTSATQTIAANLDTSGKGIPIVVYNPLNIPREDVVEITLPGAPSQSASSIEVGSMGVMDTGGKLNPVAQRIGNKIIFLAKTPSVGVSVYHLVRSNHFNNLSKPLKSEVHATPSTLENARYLVKLNPDGDVSSIFDKSLNKELLSAPIRLAISTDTPRQWPAWNMDFDQEQAAPRTYVSGPAKIRISENGPARVVLEVTRDTEGSHFIQTVRLNAGDAGNRVEFTAAIDWHGTSSNLKAVFPLTAANPNATYNEEIGTVQRPNAFDRQFEVGAHHWIDLTDTSNTFGTTILTDVKNASDKPDDHTLRLTLLRTPGYRPDAKSHPYSDQLNQDWGHHEVSFGLTGHAGDWRSGPAGRESDWQAYRLSAPLIAFTTMPHPGTLGKQFSLVQINNPRIRVLALKKSDLSDDLILRLQELDGKTQGNVTIKFPAAIEYAHEVNAQELPLAVPLANTLQPTIADGILTVSFNPYQPRAFALKLAPAATHVTAITSQPIPISHTLPTASNDDTPTTAGMDAAHNALPAEMLPRTLAYSGINFQLAPAATGTPNALVPSGQTVQIPASTNTVWVLAAAATPQDEQASFRVGSQAVPLTIQSWSGFIGQADTRIWKPAPDNIRHDWAVSANHQLWELYKPGNQQWNEGTQDWAPKYPEDYVGLRPGFVKPAALAWYASHHHNAAGLNVPYEYSYLFAYPIAVPANTHTLTLPTNPNIRILAITAATEPPPVTPAQPLFDTLNRTNPGPMIPATK